jgi:hypothetical protein
LNQFNIKEIWYSDKNSNIIKMWKASFYQEELAVGFIHWR